MSIYIKKLLPLLVIMVCTRHLSAQEKPAKTIPLFFEKVYLHTDREQYLPGESIWFKAYLIDGRNNKLCNTSNTLYVELISANAVIRDKKLIRLDGGLGNGDFKLSDSLAGGTYRLRAYTNWMRNFGDNFVFEKEIKIYSDKKEKPQPVRPPAVLAMTGNNKAIPAVSAMQTPAKQTTPADTLRFFPEGGSMVEGVETLLAFKAEDAYGHAMGFKGAITTLTGEKIVDIDSKTGIGDLLFKPALGTVYLAKGQYANGKNFNVPLPHVLLTGLTVRVTQLDTLLDVMINTNQQMLNAGNLMGLITCVSKGKTYKAFNFKMDRLSGRIQIPVNDLPAGIASITIYDNEHRPNCQRLVYIDKPAKPAPSLSTDKVVYTAKERTNVTIKAAPKTMLSVAVTDAVLTLPNHIDICTYLNLQSEIKGVIDNPAQYFDPNYTDRKRQLDLLLLTQGWRGFIWQNIIDSTVRISHPSEKGITLKGKVTEMFSDKQIPGITVTFLADSGVNGKNVCVTQADSTGNFTIPDIELYGNQQYGINATNKKGNAKGRVVLDTAFHSGFAIKRWYTLPDTLPNNRIFKIEAESRLKVTKRFSIKDTVLLKEVKIVQHPVPIERTYIDTTLKVARGDYKYETLGVYAGRLFSKYRALFPKGGFSYPRLIFTCDSVPPLLNKDMLKYYYAMPMDQVISVHCRAVHIVGFGTIPQQEVGLSASIGVPDVYAFWVDVIVKPHAFDFENLHVAHTDMDGYYTARMFYAPRYPEAGNNPDVRTTIHWDPNVVTDEQGIATVTYYNADPQNKIRVVAEGITPDGIPVSAATVYEVK